MKASLLPLAVFGVLVVFLSMSLWLDPSRVPSPLVGSPMPAFSGERLFEPGVAVSEKDFGTGPMLVNVWGTWCQGCLAEHGLLMDIASEYDIPVYGLNYRDERYPAIEWLARYGNPYRLVVYDPDAKVGLEWGVYGAPETFAIDARGIVRYKHVGILDEETFQRKMLPLIRNDLAIEST